MADTEQAKKAAPSLFETAKDRFAQAQEAWSENHKLAKEDMRFRLGEQWPDKVKKDREGGYRPCLVVDKLSQYIRQVVNDGRQNRPAVKVRPVDSRGDIKVADAYQGLIRHICDKSNADEAFDTALDHAASSGFGYFRVLTQYEHEKTFDQELCVERIRNPLAVLLDPNAQKADGSDARFGFIVDEIPKDDFARQYPKAEHTDWQADAQKYAEGWLTDSNVRVVEYFYIEDVSVPHLMLDDGTVVTQAEYELKVTNLAPGEVPPGIKARRSLPTKMVKWARLSGAEVLEENDGDGKGLGKYIPIVPVYGNEYDVDGRVIYSGLIRNAKDAQRLYNFSRSAYAERVALAPKSPWVAAAGQVDAYEGDWERSNVDNVAVLKYDPQDVNGTPVPPPQRTAAADIPAAFAQDMQISEHDIQASMGMYAASVGQPSNEKSGKAIMARQREGDTATFHYQDNLNRAIRHLGRILVDLIPRYYDAPRTIRILGEDGTSTAARIDPTQQDAVVEMGSKVIYNLGVGTYDVSVSAGPSYTTKRQEMVDMLMQLTQAQPQLLSVAGDIMVRNMDMPGGDEIADRLKALLPQQLQEKEGEEDLSADAKQIKAQASQVIEHQSQELQAAGQKIQEDQQALADKDKQIAQLELAVIEGKKREAQQVIEEAQEMIAQVQGAAEKRDQLEAQNQALATQPDALQALMQALAEMVQSMRETAQLAAQGHSEAANAMRETGQQIAAGNHALGQHILAGNAELANAVKAPRRVTGKTSRGTTMETISEVMQ
jgi:hypothetical protein